MIATASELIKKELEALGIHNVGTTTSTSSAKSYEQSEAPLLVPGPPEVRTTYGGFQHQEAISTQGSAVLPDSTYLDGEMEDAMGFNFFDMSTEMYETFSQIEPLSATMNPGFDTF